METYSVELASALKPHFDVVTFVLPGKANGAPPSLFAYGAFLLRAMFHCLIHGRVYDHVVLGDLLLFPAAICCHLVRRNQLMTVVVYGLDLVYGKRRGTLPRFYSAYFSVFRSYQKLFACIIAISTHTAKLAENAGLLNVHVVQPSLPSAARMDNESVCGAPELPDSFIKAPRRIFQFGRLVPRKGAVWFAQSVLPLLPEDVELFVAGSSTDSQELKLLTQCERTHYLGPVKPDTLVALVRNAEIVIMPNIQTSKKSEDVEGFGLAAIETSAWGGVLAASRLQGITDAVLDGVTGVLVEPGDVECWRRTLCRLLDESPDQRNQRRSTAKQAVREHYSRQRMSESLANRLMDQP